jgi:YVTN family beta-propeller protein
VTNNNSHNVSVIDTSTNTVVTTVPVGIRPFGVAVNPAGTRAYVVNTDSSNVSVIDTSTDTVVATVPVGIRPFGVAVNHAGTRVYVTNGNSDNVSGIDTSTNTVVTTVPVGNLPIALGQFIGPDSGPAEKTYDVWISYSTHTPPYNPVHDCLTITQNWISFASCNAGGPAVIDPDVVGSLVGMIQVCGGEPLNLILLGNTLNGTDIGFEADTVGGILLSLSHLSTFGFEGIRNDGCFLSSGDTGNPFTLSDTP